MQDDNEDYDDDRDAPMCEYCNKVVCYESAVTWKDGTVLCSDDCSDSFAEWRAGCYDNFYED